MPMVIDQQPRPRRATSTNRLPVSVELVLTLATRHLTTPQLVTLIDRLDQEVYDRSRSPDDLLISEGPTTGQVRCHPDYPGRMGD